MYLLPIFSKEPFLGQWGNSAGSCVLFLDSWIIFSSKWFYFIFNLAWADSWSFHDGSWLIANIFPSKIVKILLLLLFVGQKPSELYGKYTWKIEKFNQITKRELRSNAFEVGGYKWYEGLDKLIETCSFTLIYSFTLLELFICRNVLLCLYYPESFMTAVLPWVSIKCRCTVIFVDYISELSWFTRALNK